ncbi:tetratricopeptide repeat protein [Collimonas sp. OK412]|jgi:hypothetical protein|uniref:tetratricopeptide repeat protein n=1 Tax=Collimonas sp. (strain OK412) TaxID=1801619 RepID=UPI0008DF1382|nr:tetratricopeptide repeat protein [Collimonas sp. OK412]SFD38755.1 hypothetical protein SAMN04515619_1515 [Collimonas sp. OK412]
MTKDGLNTATPQILPFSQVVDRLPEACWYRAHAELFAQSLVLLLEGDSELAALDLNAVLDCFGQQHQREEDVWEQQDISLVLATGNLAVAGAIYNAFTYGAAGVVVLGDLEAGHVIVGGPEIYVCGRLEVYGLFWGAYSYGSITVEGPAGAQFWLATDEYDYQLEGGLSVTVAHWDDDSYDALPPPPCSATLLPWFPKELIRPDCIASDDLSDCLARHKFCEAVREGKPVLAPRAPRLPWPASMDSDAITPANLQNLMQTPLREGPPLKKLMQVNTDPYFSLSFPIGEFLGGVYFETGDCRYSMQLAMPEQGWLSRMLGLKPDPVLVVEFTDEFGEEPQWRILSAADIEEAPILQTAWREWLAVVAEVEPVWQQLLQEVTVERIEALLGLPNVQAIFDRYDDEHVFGPYLLAVRQASEGTPRFAFGWMGSEQRDDDGDPEYCWAHFEIETRDDGCQQVAIDFQPTSSGGAQLYDARMHLRRLPQIWNAFQAIEALLTKGDAAKMLADAEQARSQDAAWGARWEAHTLPVPGWRDVPLRQDVADRPNPPMQRFRLATPYEVREEIQALTWAGETVAFIDHLDAGEPSYFLVMDEDCTLPCLELDTTACDVAIAGFLFRGNLTLESHLLGFDSDVSPFFVVKGDLTARSLSMGGNLSYVGGNLRCEGLYGFHNHGCLVVAGALHSDVVIVKDFRILVGKLHSRALLHADDILSFNTVPDGQGEPLPRLDSLPCTCRATDILPPDLCSSVLYWQTYFPDDSQLPQRIRNGEQIVDPQRLDALFAELPEVLPGLFDWVFASPRLAGGKLIVRSGDNYDGDDFAFAIVHENGERTIGLHRVGGCNHELFIRQSPDGAFEACRRVASCEGGEPEVVLNEPITSTLFSPAAAKHAFYLALERLAFLPYRSSLAPDAPIENAASVQADIAALEQYVGDGYEDKNTLAYHLYWLWPKIQAFYPPEAAEITQLLEWNTVASSDSWSRWGKVFSDANECMERIGAYQHQLRNPDRFLLRLQVIADNDDCDETLEMLERAGELLASQASAEALLETRRKYGYLLHEAGRHEDARVFNQTLLADAEAQFGRQHAWLCPLLVNIAHNSCELDDPEDAEVSLRRALDIGELHNDVWAVDQALLQLGVLSHEQGQAETSRRYFERRWEHAQSTGNEELIAAVKNWLDEWRQLNLPPNS